MWTLDYGTKNSTSEMKAQCDKTTQDVDSVAKQKLQKYLDFFGERDINSYLSPCNSL
jgi:SAM-dependent MidA family methyltransferase